ncbi:heme exporter protein C [Limimonas halophila]|uniref:Heme exporter protein C n=1 Tax=Limimonas halophila TaxID=1082479 RepID=A0A1G7RMY3_9PROT|nr:heme ABC transporter permease [Limimonas halophila]SDG12082.1 heme exporter protein C [Limimonas halophila]
MTDTAAPAQRRWNLHRWANPGRFLRLADAVLPWLAGLTAALLAVGLVGALALSPPDYQQGMSVKIMYVHVPSAWLALFAYTTVAAASVVALVWRHPLADIAAHAASPVGAAFTFLALATGSLWGKPMWGAWWVWDARLTSMLVLFFLYLGHMALAGAFEDPARGRKAAAVLAIVGFVNVPIIKFSVDWWNTLHQTASVMRFDAPAIHVSMLWPLLVMGAGFTAFFATVVLVRMKAELLAVRERNLRALQLRGD